MTVEPDGGVAEAGVTMQSALTYLYLEDPNDVQIIVYEGGL